MNKEKYFIDLSKCSEREIKELALVMMRTKKLHEKAFNYMSKGKTFDHFICLAQTDSKEWTLWNINALFNKTELTYPEFIKLFEGGEGEKTYSIITDRAIDLVFQNTSFGENPNYRQILRDGIAKVKEGYANGRTVSLCLLELGLVEHSNEYSVTKIGEVFFAEPLNSNQ